VDTASTSGYEVGQHSVQHETRNSSLREETDAQRHAERSSLMADYDKYRNQQRQYAGLYSRGKSGAPNTYGVAPTEKKEIRVSALSWPDMKVLLSQLRLNPFSKYAR